MKLFLTAIIAISALAGFAAANYCDPEDVANTCGYGGKCIKVKHDPNFYYYMLYGYDMDSYICACRHIRKWTHEFDLQCDGATKQ